ncbi:MAG: hypothetical protein P8Y67_06585 [Alphaproteobacteria bacterium]
MSNQTVSIADVNITNADTSSANTINADTIDVTTEDIAIMAVGGVHMSLDHPTTITMTTMTIVIGVAVGGMDRVIANAIGAVIAATSSSY